MRGMPTCRLLNKCRLLNVTRSQDVVIKLDYNVNKTWLNSIHPSCKDATIREKEKWLTLKTHRKIFNHLHRRKARNSIDKTSCCGGANDYIPLITTHKRKLTECNKYHISQQRASAGLVIGIIRRRKRMRRTRPEEKGREGKKSTSLSVPAQFWSLSGIYDHWHHRKSPFYLYNRPMQRCQWLHIEICIFVSV
jgi:hypothetical protein